MPEVRWSGELIIFYNETNILPASYKTLMWSIQASRFQMLIYRLEDNFFVEQIIGSLDLSDIMQYTLHACILFSWTPCSQNLVIFQWICQSRPFRLDFLNKNSYVPHYSISDKSDKKRRCACCLWYRLEDVKRKITIPTKLFRKLTQTSIYFIIFQYFYQHSTTKNGYTKCNRKQINVEYNWKLTNN